MTYNNKSYIVHRLIHDQLSKMVKYDAYAPF